MSPVEPTAMAGPRPTIEPAPAAGPILAVDGLAHAFGGVQAVNGCSFSVPAGSITALIGPNGAGKTTVVNVVAGMLPLQRGHVYYAGTEISRWPADRVARAGLLRTFQLSREFTRLTVLENLLVAATGHIDESLWGAIVHRRAIRARERQLSTTCTSARSKAP
ncbi:MAG TPA: ATP-binding cassette domain-containing protein [Chloroflexota bacterium]|nr:ATP-binding cassette domain-containing protein [Chloroflexota bacterium]